MHQRLINTCFFLVFLFGASTVLAQETCTYSLSGKVVDEHNGQPLPFSNIYIKELEVGAVSDTNGVYRIENICKGNYTIICSRVDSEPITATLKVKGNTKHNFYPEQHTEMLNMLTVVGEKEAETPTQSQQTLSKKEMEETKGQSLGESLTKITGVTTLSTGNNISKPVIHGLHSNRILILNNGIRQEGQQWGNEHAPEIDPFIADELTVVKGANSVRYGPDAIAGVVLVNPKPLRDSAGIGGEINLGGFSNGQQGIASALVDGNFKGIPSLSWRVQGTYKRAGNVNAPNYYLKNTGVREYNFSWAAGYAGKNFGIDAFYSQFNTDIGIFSASHIGNLTDLQRAFEAEEPLEPADFTYTIDRPYQHIEHELTKFSGYVLTGDAGKLNVTYARQYNKRFEYDKHKPLNDSLAALNLPELQFEITTHTTDIIWEHNRFKSLVGSIGISGLRQGNTYDGRFFIPNFRKHGGGAFLIERWKPLDSKLELEAGIRFDYIQQEVFFWQDNVLRSPLHQYSNTSGSFGGIYQLSKKFTLKANAGTAWRPPNVNELYSDGLHHGAAAVETGDTSLVQEQAYNLSASVQYASDKLNIQVDGYYNYIDNFVYLKPVLPPTLTIRGAFPTFHYTQVDATLKGVDFTLNYQLPLNFNITSKASILRAFNETAKEYLVLMPADRFEQTLEYSLPNTKQWKNTYVALTTTNVMEQWRVPANSDFAPPPDAYMLVGIQAGADIPFGKQHITIGVGVNNLLDVSYRDYLNRFRYYTDELGRNFSVRLKIPFNITNSQQ